MSTADVTECTYIVTVVGCFCFGWACYGTRSVSVAASSGVVVARSLGVT